MIDAYLGTVGHYWQHLKPIMEALPEDRRGQLYADRSLRGEVPFGTIFDHPRDSRSPLLVGGYQDLNTAHRPKVLVQHGAAQTYECARWSPGYSGGSGRDGVGLFLCVNDRDVDQNLASYPQATAAAVGSPKLDAWAHVPAPHNDPPVVAVAFHWPCYVCPPESGWAFQDWRDVIPRLKEEFRLIGHGHPRAKSLLVNYWAQIGVEAVWDADQVLARADVLVVDNSSIGYEFAAVGRPVVWLSGAGWRRGVGWPRFDGVLPGPEVWPGDGAYLQLASAIRATLEVGPRGDYWHRKRLEVSGEVYAGPVGTMASRAAEAVLAWEAEGCPHRREYAQRRPCSTC